jgi:hypothetical protein
MNQEQKLITQQLNRELSELQFNRQSEVIKRTHPTTWKQRINAFWNKEIELPLLPIGTAIAVVIAVFIIIQEQSAPHVETPLVAKQRVLVEEGGNTYSEDVYKRAVVRIENQNKN